MSKLLDTFRHQPAQGMDATETLKKGKERNFACLAHIMCNPSETANAFFYTLINEVASVSSHLIILTDSDSL